MTREEKQKYIDTFNAIDLLHTQQYIDDPKCFEIEHNLLYTIVGRFALELTQRWTQ